MLLSTVSFLVVAQSSSEILEGLINNPVCKNYLLKFSNVRVPTLYEWTGELLVEPPRCQGETNSVFDRKMNYSISGWHTSKLFASNCVTYTPSPCHVICCEFRSTTLDQSFITATKVRLMFSTLLYDLTDHLGDKIRL